MMQGGVQLSLQIGPAPVPAPREVLETLTHAKIEIGSGDAQSGFELTFDLPVRSPLRTIFLLAGGGALPPLLRVVLIVTINGTAESVIDGMVTNVETQPGSGGVGKLVIKGKDMSALMDIIELPGLPFPAMPPSVRVLAILAKYAALGVIPMVIPSVLDIPPIPVQQIPQQKGSDYAYVKKLAGEAGYVFYLEAGPAPGASKAYWGPEIRFGAPQPALTTNMDALTNVEEISFNFDKERKVMPIVFFQEANSKAPIPVPIPDITPMSPPLGAVPPLPPKIEKLEQHRASVRAAGADGGARLCQPAQRQRVRQRQARRRQIWPRSEVAATGWRARRRPRRSTGSITSRTSPTRSSAAPTSNRSRSHATR